MVIASDQANKAKYNIQLERCDELDETYEN